ncbi:MAG: methyl-accepting chemotaxis protein [Bacteroidota bacterium]
MRTLKKKRARLITTIYYTISLPPVLIIALDYLAGVFDFDMILQLVTTWPLYVIILPFFIFFPYFMNRQLKEIESLIVGKQYEKLKGKRRRLIWVFIFTAAIYTVNSYPIGYLNGFSVKQNVIALVIAIAYGFAGNVAFIIRFTFQLDSLFAGVPGAYLENSSIKRKTLLMNVNLAIGGVMVLVAAAYCLIWRMQTMPELGYDLDFIVERLVIIGMLVAFFQVLPSNLVTRSYSKYLNKIRDYVGRISKKDLQDTIFISSRDEFGEIAEGLNMLHSNFKEMVDALRYNAGQLKQSSIELSELSGVLSDTSNNQAANAEEIASSVEETSATIAAAAENASQSVEMSKNTSGSVEEGHELITKTRENVQQITDKILKIQELADQTNLLAINAFIEAANAGEQGKGFAVVAKEIRVLADRSKQSAEDISDLATQCVQFSMASFEKSREMIDYITKTADMADLVETSSKEQHASIEQINYTVQDFNRSSQTLASSSQELAATSGALVQNAQELDRVLADFKL